MARLIRYFSSTSRKKSTYNTNCIEIPIKIERSSTDLLKAISYTIQRDPTAAHFKYHDDPYLIPVSNFQKRAYALSQESGRKAANWIREQHADLFDHKVSNPPIEKFYPKVIYNEEYDVNENDLKKVINLGNVSDALTIYSLLKNKNKELNIDTKQSLLELVCFYNSQDVIEENWIEERWYTQANQERETLRNTWKLNGFANTLFSSFQNPNAYHYSSIIQGMAKFYQFEEAYKFYQEACEKQVVLSIDAYNSIIRTALYIKEGTDHKWMHIQKILNKMNECGLSMNIGTLNSVLNVLSNVISNSEIKTYALSTISEAKKLNIDPSLATYYYLLKIFCSDRKNKSTILVDILNILEGKSLIIKDIVDTNFFMAAMENCRYHLQDFNVALRVHAILLENNNYNLIGDSYKESIYYRHFFAILCQNESVETLMKYYEDLVPHIYIPEPAITEMIIKVINSSAAVELYPKLWSDILMFDQADREPIITELTNGLAQNLFPSFNLSIKSKIGQLGFSIYNGIEERQQVGKIKMPWTGVMLGNLIDICLFGNCIEDAAKIINKLHRNQNEIIGVPSSQTISNYINYCIENSHFNELIKCIEYALEVEYIEIDEFISKILKEMSLTPMQQTHLSKLIGTEYFHNIVNKNS
ncbi:protein PTCD3 homolog, mitochondrial isoform X1 [Daktulosphaira vitifoliae]|uniref:protein PTCD3 homolog, mitochondrial isoform X1 n=1 Tax=Daktulosphaira vitifoliae TaxID=58002 RepID=UPI0021AA3DF1|nr:protein PTCD3 homolog, mitochondrial isoform X1 [Daktulosphaira vitifoliae]